MNVNCEWLFYSCAPLFIHISFHLRYMNISIDIDCDTFEVTRKIHEIKHELLKASTQIQMNQNYPNKSKSIRIKCYCLVSILNRDIQFI